MHFTSRPVWLHVIIWILIIVLNIVSNGVNLDSSAEIVSTAISLTVLYLLKIGFFYTNFLWIIPSFFAKRKWMYYTYLTAANLSLFSFLTSIYYIKTYNHTWSEITVSKLLYFSVTYFIMLVVSHIAFIAQNALKSRRKLQLLESENERNELALLRSQINPHFLFNTLNTIYGLSRRNHKETPNAVLKLSEIMRYVIQSGEMSQIDLAHELSQCHSYIDLMRMRIGSNYNLKFETPEKPKPFKILPLTLLPLVENAFKHGDLSDSGYIHITCTSTPTTLTFKIANQIGSPIENSTGTGMGNLKRRLHLAYGQNASIQFNITKDQYSLILKITRID